MGVDDIGVDDIGCGVDGRGVDGADELIHDTLFDWIDVLVLSFDSFTSFDFVSFGSLEDSSFGSFDSFVVDLRGPRFFGGGALEMQPWQYHLPRGTFIIGGI